MDTKLERGNALDRSGSASREAKATMGFTLCGNSVKIFYEEAERFGVPEEHKIAYASGHLESIGGAFLAALDGKDTDCRESLEERAMLIRKYGTTQEALEFDEEVSDAEVADMIRVGAEAREYLRPFMPSRRNA